MNSTIYCRKAPEHRSASDSQLITAVIQGEQSAFGELVTRYHGRLFASMLKVSGSVETAEELVQDSFVQAYIKLDSFRNEAAFHTWLFRIAFNKFLGLKRAARNQRQQPLQDSMLYDSVDMTESAEARCVHTEECEEVREALGRLDENARRILILREMDGLSYEQISEELQIKLGTVRSQLSRARQKLQREMLRRQA